MHFGEGSNADAEDEVVASYSIFLSSSLAKNLHIFQYPLRRKDRPYEADDVKVFCTDGERETTEHREGSLRKANDSVIDPNSRLTMRCTLDTFGSPSFCAASGYDSSMIDSKNAYSYALQSHPFQCRSDYVIGCISSDGIHITPASSVHQFTPALCANDQQGATLVGDAYCSSQSTPLLVMSTPDRVQRELLRQRSAMLNADAATAKVLKFFGSNTIESNAVCRRLLSVTHERPSPSGRREIANIENILFPPEILVSGGIVGGEEVDAYSMIHRFADRFSISFQVQHLIHRCQILPLSVLSDYIVPQVNAHATAPPNVPDFELIDALRTCAIYMHGVWVSRQCSQFKGSAAAIREVVLLTFHESDDGTVSRRDLNSLVGTSSFARQSVKDVLESIAVLNASEPQMSKRRWRLRYVSERRDERVCSAEAFRNTFPADEAAQLSHWMKAAPLVRQHISFLRTNRTPPRLHLIWSQATDNAACSSPQRMEARSASFSETELTPIRQYINALFLEHGVLNKQRVKEMVMKGKDANYPSASNQMLSEALKGCVQPFTSSTWVLRTLNEPTVDRYRPYLLACILELQRFEITALASRVEESIVQSGTQIAVPVERGIIQRVLSEVAEFKSGERLWHIKSGNASE